MIYLAVDKNGDELLSSIKIKRSYDNIMWVPDGRYCYPDEETIIVLPKGFIKKVIGHDMSWEDDPVEVTDENIDSF